MREAELDGGVVLHNALVTVGAGGVPAFVVDVAGGSRAGAAELVDADPGEDFVVGPGVGVSPVVELLVDPGEQGDRGVVESKADRARLAGLEEVVA